MQKVAIFGAAGYGGIELIRLLLKHPEVKIVYLGGHTTVGQQLTDLYPHLRGKIDMTIGGASIPAVIAQGAELLLSCLPHAVGAELVAEALAAGLRVVDFSADFRLKDPAVYEQFYQTHPAPQLLAEAVYGLPELHRDEIATARLVAVPGCYPTGAILALAPAVQARLVEPRGIIVDSKSGVSGAGRSNLTLFTHFAEINESLQAYKVAQHRHGPEIDQELSALGEEVHVTFVPHLIPITRGILTTTYATLREGVSLEQVAQTYADFCGNEPFVQVMPAGQQPATKQVSGSNQCYLGLAVDTEANQLIVTSAIDNLIKGLSGTAIQCMNLMLGFAETTGLEASAIWP